MGMSAYRIQTRQHTVVGWQGGGQRGASGSCGLQFGGQTHTFAQCRALTQDASDIQLLWSLAPEPQVRLPCPTAAGTTLVVTFLPSCAYPRPVRVPSLDQEPRVLSQCADTRLWSTTCVAIHCGQRKPVRVGVPGERLGHDGRAGVPKQRWVVLLGPPSHAGAHGRRVGHHCQGLPQLQLRSARARFPMAGALA